VIVQHQFSVVPEDHPLRRRYTTTATRMHTGQWLVTADHGACFIDLDGQPSEDPYLFDDEGAALALAERAAGVMRLWTQYGAMTAAEALERGVR
jgi:hypothetical protein